MGEDNHNESINQATYNNKYQHIKNKRGCNVGICKIQDHKKENDTITLKDGNIGYRGASSSTNIIQDTKKVRNTWGTKYMASNKYNNNNQSNKFSYPNKNINIRSQDLAIKIPHNIEANHGKGKDEDNNKNYDLGQ